MTDRRVIRTRASPAPCLHRGQSGRFTRVTTAQRTLWATEHGVPRWMALAMWDEIRQVVALVDWQYQSASPVARRAALQYELRRLRYEIWDQPRRAPSRPSCLRPSKIATYTGYRYDPAAHREARQKVDPAKRREIAKLGQIARQKEA